MSGNSPRRLPMKKVEDCQWEDWHIRTVKGHILTNDQEEEFTKEINLPHIPDMTFADNVVQLTQESADDGTGLCLRFSAKDAIKLVDDKGDRMVKVSISEDWLKARQESSNLHKIVHKFDWTYSPYDYRGTTSRTRNGQPVAETSKEMGNFRWEPTEERIDYEKLREREPIKFFDEVILFEDELDDNGCSKLSVKIRVMPSGFFILCRFYLRIDRTLIRVIDSRIHHVKGSGKILREYTEREDRIEDLKVDPSLWTDQNEIVDHLTQRKEVLEKYRF